MKITPFLAALAFSLPGFISLAAAASDAKKANAEMAKLDPAMAAGPAAAKDLVWHDITQWGVEGRAWPDEPRQHWFDRLPASAQKTVTAKIWNLSLDSTGMLVRFRTNATALSVKYQLRRRNLALTHMPATGVSGADLYARDAEGKWRWVSVAKPEKQSVSEELVKGLNPGSREYAIYLPLYNGVESFEIGVPKGAAFEGLAPRTKPIVFYGTSITQGGCASRPGMVHTAILGRRLEVPVVNLGFSGNGHMDEAVGACMIRMDASVFVIDCLPNMFGPEVTAKCIPLVKQLRTARPDVPIVLVEDRRYPGGWIIGSMATHNDENHAALRAAFATLQREGMKDIYYIPGDHLYGDDGDGSVDGSHATDLGFVRQSDGMEPVLRAALKHLSINGS